MTHELNMQQRLAAECFDRPVLVTAGAGSGKTRTLAQRFANAVIPGAVSGWSPAAVDDVLAITFTERAAGEIADRVRRTLFAAERREEGRRVDGAWISTIHGLSSRLLRGHPIEAGVDPLFRIADTVQTGRTREQAFEEAARTLLASGTEGAALFAGYPYEALFSSCVTAVRALSVFGGTPSDVLLESTDSAARLLEETEILLRKGRASRDLGYSGTSTAPVDHALQCQGLLERCERLSAGSMDEDATLDGVLTILEEYRPLRRLKGLEAHSADLTATHEDLRGRAAAALVAPYARAFKRLVDGFASIYARLKSASGFLDFDDLQIKAAELLEMKPDIKEQYRERFRTVMVDEFQDTDALQLRLIGALSDGNLCTVGDEKQSIYRFRGADIDVYRSHRLDMEARGARSVELATNYRSHPELLSFVNAVFGSEEYFGRGRDRLLELRPSEDRAPELDDAVFRSEPRVEVLFVDSTDAGGRAARLEEASEIAATVDRLCRAGAHAGDIAVLMRSYSHAHVYAEALSRRGISAAVVGGGRFFGLPETAVMRALNRVVANAEDGTALGVLLASDFVPISSDALAIVRLGSGERDGQSLWASLRVGAETLARGDDRDAAQRLVGVVERARDRVGAMPLAEVMLLAVEEAGWDLRLLSGGNVGRDAFANVLKFARQAARFERDVGTGPAGFARYLDVKERLGDTEAPATLADDESDVVRIMSIHASKGLEFPIVFVPELAAQHGVDRTIVRMARQGHELALALKTPVRDDGSSRPATSWFSAFSEADKQADAEERKRVLYVAFTRAQEALFVSGSMKMRPKTPPTSTHDLLRLARVLGVDIPAEGTSDESVIVPGTSARCRVRVIEPAESFAEDAAGVGHGGRESAEAGLSERNRGIGSRPGVSTLPPAADAPTEEVSSACVPKRMSYTQLAEFEKCPRRFWVHRVLGVRDVDAPGARRTEALRFGTALHAVLRVLAPEGALPSSERIGAIGRHLELRDDEIERLAAVARRYCESAVAIRAQAGETVRRECPFATHVDGEFLLTGSIDLYSRDGDSALVIDYKSGEQGDIAELAERYRLQAECYGLAVLRDGGDRVAVEFVRPEVDDAGGEMQRVSFAFEAADAARIEADLLRRYAEIEASTFEPVPSDSCLHCGVSGALCASAPGTGAPCERKEGRA